MGCQLQLKHRTVTQSYTRLLQQAFMDLSTCKHICHHLDINQHTMNKIAWDKFTRAFGSLSSGSQQIIQCWMFGYLPPKVNWQDTNRITLPCAPCTMPSKKPIHTSSVVEEAIRGKQSYSPCWNTSATNNVQTTTSHQAGCPPTRPTDIQSPPSLTYPMTKHISTTFCAISTRDYTLHSTSNGTDQETAQRHCYIFQ